MVDYSPYQNEEVPTSQSAPDAETVSGTSRLWLSCCGGCAGVAAFFIVGIAIVLYLFLRSYPVPPPEALFSPDADGFAVLQIEPDDQALIGLLQSLLITPLASEELSQKERRELRESAKELPEKMRLLVPIRLASVFYHLDEPQEIEEMDFQLPETEERAAGLAEKIAGMQAEKKRFNKGIALSMRRRGFSWVIARALMTGISEHGGREERYNKGKIAESPAGFAFGHLRNNIMMADRVRIVQSWIDLLAEHRDLQTAGYNGPPQLEEIFTIIDTEALFYFAISNSEGQLDSMICSLLEMAEQNNEAGDEQEERGLAGFLAANIDALGMITDDIITLGATFRIIDPDNAQLDIHAQCTTERHARDIGVELAGILNELAGEKVIVKGTADGRLAHVSLYFQDFAALLQQVGKNRQHRFPLDRTD